MQNFGNYNAYGANNPGMNRGGIARDYSGTAWAGNGYSGVNYQPAPAGAGQMNAGAYNPVPAQWDGRVFVTGRAGADAYPMPIGVNMIILWDTDARRFYIKGYDNNGIPRVLEDNDYQNHADEEAQQAAAAVDMSMYATKDDIKSMVTEAVKRAKMPNMSGYVTQDMLNKALSELCVGSGGKVVRGNDADE